MQHVRVRASVSHPSRLLSLPTPCIDLIPSIQIWSPPPPLALGAPTAAEPGPVRVNKSCIRLALELLHHLLHRVASDELLHEDGLLGPQPVRSADDLILPSGLLLVCMCVCVCVCVCV